MRPISFLISKPHILGQETNAYIVLFYYLTYVPSVAEFGVSIINHRPEVPAQAIRVFKFGTCLGLIYTGEYVKLCNSWSLS